MISDISMIESLMGEISDALDSEVDVYMIGGGAMMYLDSKPGTKDIDLIVRSEDDFHAMISAMKSIGFISIRPGEEYKRMNLSGMYERSDGFRVDIFDTRVCSKLSLSDHMAARAKQVGPDRNARLHVCSPMDILIFKSITEREGDETDCLALMSEHIIDWDEVLSEIRYQISEGEDVWITWIADRMYYFSEKFGSDIPILDDLLGMADRFLDQWEREMEAKAGELGGKDLSKLPPE
ncbi:MAG: hypothetical protein Q4Q62_06685 [Thermoplasmata archaeon]|nr:hypothetical protein [Thermoplasmata archaeon]